MSKNWRLALILPTLLILLFSLASGQPQNPPQSAAAGIWQLVESRNGRTSCWGVIIQLSRLTFPATLQASAIEISEVKHDRSLKDLMEWKVDSSRKQLTIQFRPGIGDFGTGNRVEVRIEGAALEPNADGPLVWVIGTDPL